VRKAHPARHVGVSRYEKLHAVYTIDGRTRHQCQKQNPNSRPSNHAISSIVITLQIKGKRQNNRHALSTLAIWSFAITIADIVADSCLFCFPKGSSKERQGSSREYTPECHTGTHWHHDWHTLAHTGTHWHYQCVSYGDRKCSGFTAGREASVSDRVMPKSGGLGVRGCCHAPSANAPRHQTWTSIVWMTHQSGCGIKVDRGIKRESIKAMMRCLRF